MIEGGCFENRLRELRGYATRRMNKISDSDSTAVVPQLSTGPFLRQLSKNFPMKRVYYPGCWEDTILEKGLPKRQIIYLDEGFGYTRYKTSRGNRIFVRGDFSNAPFSDAKFDAAFIQDIHPNASELDDILRTVKPEGIVIFSKNDCMNGDPDDLEDIRNHPLLNSISLPFTHKEFLVFQRRLPRK